MSSCVRGDLDRLGDRDAERARMVGRCARIARPDVRSRSTATRCSARRRFPSARGGTASGRTTRAPGRSCTSMPNNEPANASAEPHWPAPVSVVSFLMPACALYAGLRHRGVGLVRAGGRDAFVLVVDLAPACRAPARGGARGSAATAATDGTPRGSAPGSRPRARWTPPAAISAIGNSGARSSGPTGCWVPGCSTGGAGLRQVGRRCCTSGAASCSRRAQNLVERAHRGVSCKWAGPSMVGAATRRA